MENVCVKLINNFLGHYLLKKATVCYARKIKKVTNEW